MRNRDRRIAQADVRFAGLIEKNMGSMSGGLLRARGDGKKTLGFAATRSVDGKAETAAFYEMGPDMKLQRTDEPGAVAWMATNVAIPRDAVKYDEASVIYMDEAGKRFRLPKGRRDFVPGGPFGASRTVREVCTERDLLNCAGTFFELPAENAGGIAKVRPIATHNRSVHDFATWRGLLVISGVAESVTSNPHIVRSEDGRVALWVGAVDDLWSFGRPVGEGGPWKSTKVKGGEPSDPYLMTGYERKKLTLSHESPGSIRMNVEVDLTGTGHWVSFAVIDVPAGMSIERKFPDAYQAYWIRVTADTATTATAWLVCE
jgi:hypothetical protein